MVYFGDIVASQLCMCEPTGSSLVLMSLICWLSKRHSFTLIPYFANLLVGASASLYTVKFQY